MSFFVSLTTLGGGSFSLVSFLSFLLFLNIFVAIETIDQILRLKSCHSRKSGMLGESCNFNNKSL